MFSWICPQCGHDVPPSEKDCPFCAERARQAGVAATTQPETPQTPQWQPPPAAWQQPQPQWQPPPPPPREAPISAQQAAPQPYAQQTYAPPPYAPQPQQQGWQPPAPEQQPPAQSGYQQAGYPPPPYYAYAPHQPQYGQRPAEWQQQHARRGVPTWLMAVGVAVILLLVGGGIYFGLQRSGATAINPQEKAGVENPSNPSKQKVTNPLQKYVEVVGLRMLTENKKPVAKFVIVNHSNAEIDDLAANVTLWASTSRSEEDSVGSFNFRLPRIGANESKEMTEPLKTKLKVYELPDWQNATADVEITSPSGQ